MGWIYYIYTAFLKIFHHSQKPALDHFAIIDLTSGNSGIEALEAVFKCVGFSRVGAGYLPTKQNDFIWMTTDKSVKSAPNDALPQVVLADFRYEELSQDVQKILKKYSSYIKPINYEELQGVVSKAMADENDVEAAVDYIEQILIRKDWPDPTLEEYLIVQKENPLIAWVLLFGRKVNHFGFGIYTIPDYKSLESFTHRLQKDLRLSINIQNGMIKGSPAMGIEQSSTMGDKIYANLGGKVIEVNDSFMEFVWRYPVRSRPKALGDYYHGFIPENANNVIESLTVR